MHGEVTNSIVNIFAAEMAFVSNIQPITVEVLNYETVASYVPT